MCILWNFIVSGLLWMILLFHSSSGQLRTEFLDALLLDYESTVYPTFNKGTPTTVTVQLYVNSLDSVDEQKMEFSIDTFVTQEWLDERLESYGVITDEYLELDNKKMNSVWVPDLYFANEKRAYFHEVTVPNKMMHLYEDGRVKYRIRISLTSSCPMQLHKYPMDTQICSLYIQSFAYTVNSIRFEWHEEPIKVNDNLQLPQFELGEYRGINCSRVLGGGNFTCVEAKFVLRRNIGFCMIQIYVPSTMIVLLSWVSFWLNVDAIPARISLGILTVLTMTTQKTLAVSSLPKVSYIKAIDVWMATGLMFVFAALIEFAIVNVLERKHIKARSARLLDSRGSETNSNQKGTVYIRDHDAKLKAKYIDNMCRLIFPVAYVLFCVVYFFVYTVLY